MKNKKYLPENETELSADLEWMLQSGQVSLKLLIETLVETYYSKLHKVAVMLLDDRRAARIAVRDTFTQAVLNLHGYRSQTGVETWLYKIEMAAINRVRRREGIWHWLEKTLKLPGELTERSSISPTSEVEKNLWLEFDQLEAETRQAMLLTYGCSWSSSRIAEVTGIEAEAVEAHLSRPLAALEGRLAEHSREVDAMLSQVFDKRWPNLPPGDQELHSLAKQIQNRAGKGYGFRGKIATVKEMTVIGVAILLVALIIWGGSQYFLREDASPSNQGINDKSGLILPVERLPDWSRDFPDEFTNANYRI